MFNPLNPLPRSSNAHDTPLLVLAQPSLVRLTQNPLSEVVDKMTDHDEHKGHGVHPMNMEMEDLDANNHLSDL